MNEAEFLSLIDCRFPYHDRAEAQRLLKLGCSISANAAFSVVHEVARVPAGLAVALEARLELLQEVAQHLKHPLSDVVLGVAGRLVRGEHLSLQEVQSAMREVGTFPDQYQALNVVYFSGAERARIMALTAESIRHRVQQELDAFSYAPPEDTVGTPFSKDRIDAEVALLRSCLVEPQSRIVILRDTVAQIEAPTPVTEQAWIVARAPDSSLVLFHPAEEEFGLALEGDGGAIETIGVRGDLVGTFVAR